MKTISGRLSGQLIINRLSLVLLLILCHYGSLIWAIKLVGVTIQSHPFVYNENNLFKGFCVDLMDLISEHSGLNYSLYFVKDNTYGPGEGTGRDSATGLIGDVYRKKADFAIADMTITERRAKYVTFSEPFLKFSFSALVRRSLAKNLETIDDLAVKSNLTIGTYRNGKTMLNMQVARKKIRNVRWLYKQLLLNDSNLVSNMDEALLKIRNESYAFLQEQPKNLYYSSRDCSLKTLVDQNYYTPGQYAIAFHPDSPHIDTFNRAIKKIYSLRQMNQLIRKHFYNSHCSNSAAFTTITNGMLLIMLTINLGFIVYCHNKII